MDRSEIGKLGNRAAREKNPEHQSEAGKAGIRGLANKYFSGSVGEAMSWLRSRRNEYQVAELIAEKQAGELAKGCEIVCEELPVLLDADDDPFHFRDMVSERGPGRRQVG